MGHQAKGSLLKYLLPTVIATKVIANASESKPGPACKQKYEQFSLCLSAEEVDPERMARARWRSTKMKKRVLSME